jgi:hypothetical protein
MKNSVKLIIVLFFSIISSQTFAQKQPKKVEITFGVKGECGMCKDRIEKALDTKGILIGEWNQDTKTCRVVFKPKVISEMEIHQLIANLGHDTDKIKATDEAYKNLHGCCKYQR